jgi:hypothetical protein
MRDIPWSSTLEGMPREYPPLEPDPVIEAYKKDIDRTLIRENLKLTPTERVEKLMEFQRFADEIRRAGRELRERERDDRFPRTA